MKHWFMLTVVGRDQPGIVAGLTDALYRTGANLGEASMTRLGENFTIMLMVETALSEAEVRGQLSPFADPRRLQLHIHQIEGRLHQHVVPNVQVAVHGADRPGIVAQVTGALSKAGLNILDLDTDVGGSDDKPIYIMLLVGYVAGGVATIARVLEPLRSSGIEVQLTAIDPLVG